MFKAKHGADPRWMYGISGDFSAIGTKYHALKMLERKDARIFKKYTEKARRADAFERLREFDVRLEKIKTDLEFERIIEGNTETETPKNGPKHRYDRLTLGQRIYAWWCGHAF